MAHVGSTENIIESDGAQSTAVNGNCTRTDDDAADSSGRFQTGFGCLRCRPAALQCLASARWFLVFICATAVFQSMVVNGLVGVTISTIERRFALASSQTAWIAASYEIAGAPVLLVIGYLGSTLHRPMWIGSGLVMLGVGFGIYSIPHFAAPLYSYAGSGDSSNLCLGTSWNTSNNASLTGNDRCTSDELDDGNKYLAAFIIAMVLQGFGAVPLYVLGVTYLDDASSHGTASVHIGMFYSASVVGPVIAYICGGFLLNLYTHFDTVDTSTITLQQNDPRWVGAWWIGYLVAMVATLLIAPAFFGYPPDPSTKHHREKSASSKTSSDSDGLDEHEMKLDLHAEGLAGVVKTVKSLATNGPYMFAMLYGVFDAILINGCIAFGAKYFQQQFGLTASMAGIIFGVVTVPGGAGGFLLGSCVIKRLSLTSGQQLRAMFFLAIICIITMLMFFVQCDAAPLADVSLSPYRHAQQTERNGVDTSKNTCSSDCSCEVEWFEPVCGANGLTYFSPCYAGCHNSLGDTEYGNCSCIGDVGTNTSDASSTAVPGVCAVTSCYTWKLVLFFLIFFFAMIIIFVCGIFHVSALLRVVEHSERPFAYAIDWLFQRVAGGVPGPILFGFALDHSCLLWEQKCDGSTGACLYYDNHQMAWLLLAVCASCKVLNIVCGLLSWQLYVHKYSRGNRSPKQTAVEYMLSLDEPVNGQTQNSLYGSTENMVAEVDRDQAGAVSNPAEEAETSD